MSESIDIRQPTTDELQAVLELRHAVLDPDQSEPSELELSATDYADTTIQMVAFDGDKLVSAARLQPSDQSGEYMVRKVATDPSYRGRGIAAKVVVAAEAEAIRRGATSFTLHSRPQALPLYARLSYVETGQTSPHHGILGIEMKKQVKS